MIEQVTPINNALFVQSSSLQKVIIVKKDIRKYRRGPNRIKVHEASSSFLVNDYLESFPSLPKGFSKRVALRFNRLMVKRVERMGKFFHFGNLIG